MAAVPSLEPSSTTSTRSTPGSPAAPATVARMRSDSFLAGMMTATSSAGAMSCSWWPAGIPLTGHRCGCVCWPGLLAGHRGEVVVDGEDRCQAGHFQDLADRRARRRQREVAAALAGLAMGGEQDVHPGGVAEIDT